MTYVLGLTGGIASGKSLVSHYFLSQNIPVVDGDLIAREVVAKGSRTLVKLVETFGGEILSPEGSLNRKKLGKIIFEDEKARKKLDELMDAAIRKKVLKRIEEAKKSDIPLIVLDLPLLFERNYQENTDGIMVVVVTEDIQLKRLMKRDQLTKPEALQRLKAQLPLLEKAKKGDFLIDNNGSKEETLKQVDKWLFQQHFF